MRYQKLILSEMYLLCFWSICLDEYSSNLCAFATPHGRYKFLCLPFGIKTGSEIFQLNFKNILTIDNVQIYIDDILVHGKTKLEHDTALNKVFEIARKNNVKFNLKKSKFSLNKVNYVGYRFSNTGILIDQEKINAITKILTPNNKTEVQNFLGFITYIGKFIKSLSEKTKLLRGLIKNDIKFEWLDIHEKAFIELKDIVTNRLTLNYFDTT